MNKLELNILGDLTVCVNGAPISFPTRHCALTLVYLSMQPELAAKRETLSTLFWGDKEDRQARNALRQTIYRLNKALEGANCAAFVAGQSVVRLDVACLECDYLTFLAELEDDAAVRSAALKLYRGDLLKNLGSIDPGFDDWLRDERLRLRHLVADELWRQAEDEEKSRKFRELEVTARRLVALDEYDERALRLVISACGFQGRRNAALSAYRQFADFLADQLGVSPEPETTKLVDDIRRRESQAEQQITIAPELPYSETRPSVEGGVANTGISEKGERRKITALAVAIPAIAAMDQDEPELADHLMAPLTEALDAAAQTYGGQRFPISGDEALIVFGIEPVVEDHAERACRAAHMIMDAQNCSDGPLEISLGLDTGVAMLRARGGLSPLERVDARAVLARAKRAARLVHTGQTGLTNPVASRIAGSFETEEVRSAGESEPLFLMGSPTGDSSRSIRMGKRVLSAFAGRRDELAALHESLRRVIGGQGELAAIVGEAGVGKSRLLLEFLETPIGAEVTVVKAATATFGRTTPYHGIANLLRAWLRVDFSDKRDDIAQKLDEQLVQFGISPQSVKEPLSTLLGLPVSNAQWDALTPAQRRAQIIKVMGTILSRQARLKPTLIVLEDLHWLDAESQAVLDAVIDDLHGIRLLLLVTFRPEYQHGWMNRSYFRLVRVNAFSDTELGEFVDGLIGHDESLLPVRTRLLEKSGGNPLFLEEMVSGLLDAGVLVGLAGDYRLVRELEDQPLPASISDILATRINRLPPDEKALLQVASVIGANVPLVLLRHVYGVADDEFEAGLEGLRRAEMIFQVKWDPETEYEFRHSLTHEAAQETLVKDYRVALHVRTLAAMEEVYAGRLNEQLTRLAYHAEQGKVWDKAVSYLRRAADQAIALSAYAQARQLLVRAVTAADRLPKTRENVHLAIELRLSLRPVLVTSGAFKQALGYLEESETIAKEARNRDALAAAAVQKSYLLSTHGRLTEAADAAKQAIAAGKTVETESMRKEAVLALAQANCLAGIAEQVIGLLEPIQAFWTGDNRHERFGQAGTRSVWCHGFLGSAYALLGRFDDATKQTARACAIAAESDRSIDVLFARHRHGAVLLDQGELDRATGHLKAAHRIALEAEVPIFPPWIAADLGRALALGGRLEEARCLFDKAIDDAVSLDLQQFALMAQVRKAEMLVAAKDFPHALDAAQTTFQTSRQIGDRLTEVIATRAMGQAQAGKGHQEAGESLSRACDLAEQYRFRPELARSRIAYASWLRASGEISKAGALEDEAQREFDLCGMRVVIPA